MWVRLIYPVPSGNHSLAVFKSIVDQIPKGLILFDRGFNGKKVFAIVLGVGIICCVELNPMQFSIGYTANGSNLVSCGSSRERGDT